MASGVDHRTLAYVTSLLALTLHEEHDVTKAKKPAFISEIADPSKSRPARPELPKRCYWRGQTVWIRYKDASGEWVNETTEYRQHEVEANPEPLKQYVKSLLGSVSHQRVQIESGAKPLNTVRAYVKRWLEDRSDRGISAAKYEEPGRLARAMEIEVDHGVKLGDLEMHAVRPKHAQEVVRYLRALKGEDKLSPRTIIHTYRTLRNVFESAVVDEVVVGNPIKVKKGELPKKVDADLEWRAQATYTVREVERLISDSLIPVERRVQYALKALAGLRHQEVAALCWRHIDHTAEPLARINVVQAYDSRECVVKSTKDGESREVPLHPTLAKILAAWKLEHWERIYGRKPKDDDYVVPTRNFTCVNVADAGRAMPDDLLALGLRVKAGKKRKRGGHDLRSWFETRCIEDGGDSKLIDRLLHAADKSVAGGYQRFSWATLCRELAKLKVGILDGKVLPLVTESFQAEKKAGNRWRKEVTPKGLERSKFPNEKRDDGHVSTENTPLQGHNEDIAGRPLERVRYMRTAAGMLERALRAGDTARAMRIVNEMKDADADVVEPPALSLVK
jgi:integrase